MTYLDQLLHEELFIQRENRDVHLAEAYVANILVEVCEYRLGYSANCQQAMDMISEGSPPNGVCELALKVIE